MVIDIEYMSDSFVRPPLWDLDLSVSSSSGGDQRVMLQPLDVALRDPAAASARQAQSSSSIKIFAYTNVSVVVRKRVLKSYSSQVTMNEIHVVEVLKTTCGVL